VKLTKIIIRHKTIGLILILVVLTSTFTIYPFLMMRDSWIYENPEDGGFGRIVISDDGNYIAATSDVTGDIYFFRRTNSKPIWIYHNTLNDNVHKLAISSSGQTIAAYTFNGKLLIFSKNSSIPLWTTDLEALSDYSKMVISKDGKSLLIGYRLFDIVNFLSLHIFGYSSTMTADGKFVLTCIPGIWHPEGFVETHFQLTDTSNFSKILIYNYTGNTNSPYFSISSNGDNFAVGSENGIIYYYHKNVTTPLWNYSGYESIKDIEISANGNDIIAFDERFLYFFQANSPLPVWYYSPPSGPPGINSISISSDGNYIGASIDRLYLFHRSSSNPIWQSQFFSGFGVSLSHDGKFFATANGKVYFISREYPQVISDYDLYFICLYLIGYPSSIIITLIIFSKKYKKKRERKRFEKFRSLIKGSDQIEVEKIYGFFKKEYDKRTFYRKIFEWASEFNFTLDGEILLLKEGSITDFIKLLDDMYIKWEQEEIEKI